MAVKTLADGKTKLAILAIAPENPEAPTVTELEAGIDASCNIAKTGYTLGPTTSETINDPELCVDVNSTVYGASNFEGTFGVFRFYDEETGQVDEQGDEVFQALKAKGTEVWLVERETAKKSTEAFEAGDEVSLYRVLLDNPQKSSDRTGYVKSTIVPAVQAGYLNVEVAGGSGS
ncbi:phage tail tube protein [Brachybacterium alimentarium]|uniref:phage tail tube protein n=1 Tax=Brachybacterium alimentarium TaxID=47845 RepID=UPI003FD5E601